MADTCYDTVWEAVSAVEGATFWQRYLETNGYNRIMDDEEYRGTVFVVLDSGLTTCNVSEIQQWPQSDCGQRIREYLSFFASDAGNSLLMYHWLPGETVSSIDDRFDGYPTLVQDALSPLQTDDPSGTRMRFTGNETVALLPNTTANEGRLGGYMNATIVDEKNVCDESTGHVYVLDRPLYPSTLPLANSTGLPPLSNYCDDTIFNFMVDNEYIQLTAILAVGSYALPIMYPLTDPGTNITLFAPKFDTREDLQGLGLVAQDNDDLKDQVTLYFLASMLEGGYCPSDFGGDGLVLNTIAGDAANASLPIFVQQDRRNPNKVNIQLMFGNANVSTYTADYLGKVCHSTVYRISSLLQPWKSTADSDYVNGVPFDSLEDLPRVSSQEDLFGVPESCALHSSSNSLSGGAIAGIVVGSCSFLVICVLGVWALRRARFSCRIPNRGKRQVRSSFESNLQTSSTDEEQYSGENEGLILKQSEISIDKDPTTGEKIVLGRGRFGKVYRGTLLGSEPVAVKCVRETALDSEATLSTTIPLSFQNDGISFGNMTKDQILKEIGLLKSCRSQYIVSFTGAMFCDHEVRLVTELMPSGDLWHALGHNDNPRKVSWYENGIFIAMDVAAGLNYLHEKKRVIHLDLKSSNILLRNSQRDSPNKHSQYTGAFQAKISDVGLSRFLPVSHEYLSSANPGGTWNWCAPEVILNAKCTPAVDMYSYGVVLWEICTGETPVRGCMREVRVPEECPQEVAELIKSCLSSQYSGNDIKRPSAGEALGLLQSILHQDESAVHTTQK